MKLIGSTGLDQSWDGTFNGSPLEATDYWYKVDLVKKSGECYNLLEVTLVC